MHTDWLARLATHVTGTRLEHLPAAARGAARTFVLDTLGVAVAGSADPWARRLAPLLAAWGEGVESALWVHGTRLPAVSAALGNAHFGHCLEFDPVHEGAVVHAMAPVLAAALAQAERQGGCPGAELLAAVALGVDVAAAIGQAATGPMRFFRPATAGAWGAVAAAGRVAGLSADALRAAWGALYSQLSGTLQPHVEGSPLLAMQMGFAARAALTALDLARAGLPAPQDVLQGPYGYFALFEGGAVALDAPEAPFARLGSDWQIARLSHKPYPSGRLTQGAVDGLLRLQAQMGFAADDVEAVQVRLPPLALRLVARPDVPDPAPAYARLCLPFVAATALRFGTVDVPHFAAEALRDAGTHALAARIHAAPLPNPDERAIAPQEVEVRLRSGATHGLTVTHILGHPEAPLSRDQHLAKFRRNWGYGARPLPPEAGEALIARVEALETVADVRALVTLLGA